MSLPEVFASTFTATKQVVEPRDVKIQPSNVVAQNIQLNEELGNCADFARWVGKLITKDYEDLKLKNFNNFEHFRTYSFEPKRFSLKTCKEDIESVYSDQYYGCPYFRHDTNRVPVEFNFERDEIYVGSQEFVARFLRDSIPNEQYRQEVWQRFKQRPRVPLQIRVEDPLNV